MMSDYLMMKAGLFILVLVFTDQQAYWTRFDWTQSANFDWPQQIGMISRTCLLVAFHFVKQLQYDVSRWNVWTGIVPLKLLFCFQLGFCSLSLMSELERWKLVERSSFLEKVNSIVSLHWLPETSSLKKLSFDYFRGGITVDKAQEATEIYC